MTSMHLAFLHTHFSDVGSDIRQMQVWRLHEISKMLYTYILSKKFDFIRLLVLRHIIKI